MNRILLGALMGGAAGSCVATDNWVGFAISVAAIIVNLFCILENKK